MVNRILLALALILGTMPMAMAQGIPSSAIVTNTCGVTPTTYTPGQNAALLQDTTGRQCSTSLAITSAQIGITPTDRTITSATGASQTVMPANAARHSLTIENTGNANCGVNPTGGTAVIGGAGTLTLYPGGSYSPRVPTLSSVTAICTAGQPLYADEN